MRKPSLTDKVMRGLTDITSVFDADLSADFFGFCEPLDKEERRTVDDAFGASEWIGQMNQYRKWKKEKGHG